LRLILDTDVVVAALRSPKGASGEILRMLGSGHFVVLVSVALALEYEAICMLPEHILASGLRTSEVEQFVANILDLAEPVEIHYRWRPMLRDSGDEMVLEAAVNGQADALVTFNQRDYPGVRSAFGIDVVLPREIVALVRSQNQ
jgi:putative PIN family toxin of toxin-antitoxin system